MTKNPFIDDETHTVNHFDLNYTAKAMENIGRTLQVLQTQVNHLQSESDTGGEFCVNLLTFSDGLEDLVDDSIKPLETYVSDALSYEDYLIDKEHERIEKDKLYPAHRYVHGNSS